MASIHIEWPEGLAHVTITNGSGGQASFTVDGEAVSFPYKLTKTTTFSTEQTGTFVVSVIYRGIEIAHTPDQPRIVVLSSNTVESFAPSRDGRTVGQDEDLFTALNNAFAKSYSATAAHSAIKGQVRRMKGGLIGTTGKPVVSLRIDHGIQEWLDTYWPLFRARGLTASFGVVTDSLDGGTYEPTTYTWADLRAAARQGFEVYAHSKTHEDPATVGTTLHDEIVGSKERITANGLTVMGWQQPGTSGPTNYSNSWDGDWNTESAQLILGNYGLMELIGGRGGGRLRYPPNDGFYGADHYTLDSLTYTAAKGYLDAAIARGGSTQWMLHPRFIEAGTVTATRADIISFLDYVKQLWDAGTIEVLTSSGQEFADPGRATRLQLLTNTTFDNNLTDWAKGGGSTTGIAVQADGGHTGTKYVRFPYNGANDSLYIGQDVPTATVDDLSIGGGTFLVEGWARCSGPADGVARLIVIDGNDAPGLTIVNDTQLVAGSGWTRIRQTVTWPNSPTAWRVRVGRRQGPADTTAGLTGAIDWDDVTMKVL